MGLGGVARGVLGILVAASSCGGRPPAGPAVLTRGPYLQLLTPHSVTIVWNTDRTAACAVTIHPVDGNPRTVPGASGTVCAVGVDGLAPGGRYAYAPLADGTPLDGESAFRTDHPGRPFTFLVVGDSGSGTAEQQAVRDRMLALPADFVLSTGDMIYDAGKPEELEPAFFVPYRDLIRRVVFWPTLGNHDVRTGAGQPWRDAFYTPANNPARSENYYSFDFGNAHLVVLDSNADTAPGSGQYAFLDADLAASTARWTFVAFHHAIYSTGTKHGSNLRVRANLVPLFDRHRVDLVFMGHNHVYERTWPLRNDAVVGPGNGTIYVTTGGGGKKLQGLGPPAAFTAYAEVSHHFTRVTVDGDALLLQVVRADGSIPDVLTLSKAAGRDGQPAVRAAPRSPASTRSSSRWGRPTPSRHRRRGWRAAR